MGKFLPLTARSLLLAAARSAIGKPADEPEFPGTTGGGSAVPEFPGQGGPIGQLESTKVDIRADDQPKEAQGNERECHDAVGPGRERQQRTERRERDDRA